jgi:hypothetical protein
MLEKFDETDPSVQRIVETEVRQALAKHGVALGSRLEIDLRQRIKVVSGYHGELLVRAIDNDNELLSPDAYLTQKREGVGDLVPQRPTAPYRISKRDSNLINASAAEIASGIAVVVDDRELFPSS